MVQKDVPHTNHVHLYMDLATPETPRRTNFLGNYAQASALQKAVELGVSGQSTFGNLANLAQAIRPCQMLLVPIRVAVLPNLLLLSGIKDYLYMREMGAICQIGVSTAERCIFLVQRR